MRVLLLESIHGSADELLGDHQFHVERVAGALGEDELVTRVGRVDLLGIRSKTRVTARVLDAAPHLLAVGAFCIGTNQIDLGHANQRGVPVFNAPFSNTRSVAELILAEVVMLSRQLVDRIREVHDGTWRKLAGGCHEIRGKILGIIGYGHIGRQVGVLAEAVGMQVRFHDGKDSLPARLLAHAPRAAFGAGVFELTTPHASKDLGHRELAVARLVASATAGCAFCLDLNAAGHGDAGLSRDELHMLVGLDEARWGALGHREHTAARFALALSRTPVEVPAALGADLRARFSERAIVMLATAIAQVNYWARFNQALGIPAAGFFPELACAIASVRRPP